MTIHSESGLKGFVLPFVVPSLVVTRNADLLLLDDMKARRAATSWGLTITRKLGILDQAATMKLIIYPLLSKAFKTHLSGHLTVCFKGY